SPVTGTIALHPNREKIYVMTEPKGAEIENGEIRIYSTANLALLKTISYFGLSIMDAKFTKDGSRLFCCVPSRGIIVLDAIKDQIEPWGELPDYPVTFGLGFDGASWVGVTSLDISSDEQELYISLGDKDGGLVAAINIAQKNLTRTLRLSQTTCTSVAVIGDKLFAACLDGVYVIDIPVWRQHQ
ncbi:MAG: hypothetical protein RMK94_02640, partial [Armatimonadota bacterium]|nr:hypothetical protein [Armatimonadota bacterium]